MASLGRLTIDMVANIGGFERDMGRADRVTRQTMRRVSRELNRAERDVERATRTIRNLGLQLAAISAVGIAAVTREFRNMATQADRLDKLAQATGVTVEELQRLGFAAEQSGSDLETVARSVTQLQRNIQGATDGLSTYTRAFERIGIAIEDLQGLSPDEQFRRVAQALSQVGDAGVRNATALELFGRAGRDLLPLLARGEEGIRELGDAFERTGAIISSEAAADFARFNDQLNLLRQQAQALRVSVLSDLIQPLADFVEFLNTERGTELMRDALNGVRNAAIALGAILAGRFALQLGAASIQLVTAAANVARLTFQKQRLAGASVAAAGAVTGLRIAVSTLLGPVGIALAVIGSLAPALITLRQEFREVAQESDSLADRFDRLTQSASEFRVEQLRGLLQEVTAEQEKAARQVEQAAIRLQAAQDRFNRTGDARAGAAILELAEELDAAQGAYDDLAAKARQVGQLIEEAMRPAGDSLDDLGDQVDDAARRLEQFRRRIEDTADALQGAEAQAVRRFNRRVAEATQLLAEKKLSLDEYIASVQVLRDELRGAVQQEAPGFVEFIDNITNALTRSRAELESYVQSVQRLALTLAGGATGFDFFGDGPTGGSTGSSLGAQFARNLSFALSANDGRSLGTAVGNAFRTFGAAGIQEGLQDSIAEALSNLDLDDTKIQIAFLAIGEAIAGNIGASVGTAIGAGIGAALTAGNPAGAQIGAIIGNALGGIFDRQKDPKFQLGGTTGFSQTGGTPRGSFASPFGATLFRFRNVEDAAARQIQDALVQFDNTLAALIRDDTQLATIASALRNFAFDSADEGATIQDVLEQRFALILGTFDAFTQSLVRQGFGLEEQAQRLADIVGIRDFADTRGLLRFDSADAIVAAVAALNQGGETLADTFDRVRGTITSLLDSDELIAEAAGLAQARAAELLAQIGVDAAGLSGEQLQQVFRELFGTLSDADTLVLLEAGEAIVDLIEAEEQLARARRQAEEERWRVLDQIDETIALTPLNDFQRELVRIQRQLRQNITELNRTASAASSQAEAELDLARAHEAAALQVAAAIARLEESAAALVDQVFGTPLDEINRQIAELQAQSNNAAEGLANVNTALANLIAFADGLLVGNLSPLGSRRRLEEGLAQLRAASAAGDAARVQQLANQVLGIGRERFASGDQFSQLFNEVQSIIRGTRPVEQVQAVSIVASPALEALFAERDRLEAEIRERELKSLGLDLAQVIADLAGATGDTFAEVADRLGFDLLDLADRLGFEGSDFEEFLASLQVDTDSIAESLEDIGEEITESIRDFADRSIPVQERTESNTADIADAVNRLIDVVRDGQVGESRSTRTRVTP